MSNARIHFFNQNFFENINNEDAAYFLGFLYADGSISKNRIKINLAIKDRSQLERFAKSVGYLGPIIEYESSIKKLNKNYKSCNIQLNSKKMIEDLFNLGCTPNKSFTIRMPNLNSDLTRHFVRGYFDGDGCFSVKRIEFYCNDMFALDLKTYFENNGVLVRISKHGSISKAAIGEITNMWKAYNLLYKNSSVFLDRKKNLIENHLYRKQKMWLLENVVDP